MPIYAYRCEHCGFQQDVLRKMSDPLLVTCPSCGQATFRKQLTAAGFQLKGSGWYVTDFRNPATKQSAKPQADGADGSKADGSKADAAPSDAKPAADGPAPAAAPMPTPGPSKPDASPAKTSSPSPGAGSG
jgi:putative FmdB family regulatory protein